MKNNSSFIYPLYFAANNKIINFAMEKDKVKKISVWEKVSDFLMDISKYVLTAVIITSAFEELSGVGWIMYIVGITGSLIFFGLSVLIIHLTNKNQ